ncbi:TMEM175 family protein [Furfurilactobacillus rossiae]|uniref:Integral membrane protein n=1 Tax=Furfurilactobacillus rossiae DSM 15814 TaxID=1114972 RepID=A0A0R1RJE3_9LACO|nr:TMEM175 family protein [Furfurilactobacillus rossiae]KRL56855.1 integral membrane protein [Furfurilactobacillus rossiae DSM 15814]MCF6165182.1 DUF1211 domain-containing protein [Furfurilactobacillus rossiae]QFR67114.1 DUF1211 domain-containing protein [Furfurilactobacillus rossiae]QLE62621.1 Integral membrane protein [Furfurilactobacillus rossiae]QLE65338.1 Integral membrane protein [Furfurilactobacillus rossiae]
MMFKNSKSRLVAISDGVFAVVLTIMVLGVVVPEHPTKLLIGIAFRQIVIFLISFAIVAQYWMLHQELFSALEKVSVRVIVMNFYYLALISLIPFVTAWLSRELFNRIVVITFATVLVLVDLLQYLLFRLVVHESHMTPKTHDLEEIRSTKMMFWISVSYVVVGGIFPKTLLVLILLGMFTRTVVTHWYRQGNQ